MNTKVTREQMDKLPYIIAVDFDGTIVEDKYPEIGSLRRDVLNRLLSAQSVGHKIILWTSRDGEFLQAAVRYCADRGLHFDAINDNIDEVTVLFNNSTRKVYANEYWDDRARVI